MAPRIGFEPMTYRLTAGCSTAELSGNRVMLLPELNSVQKLEGIKSWERAYIMKVVLNVKIFS